MRLRPANDGHPRKAWGQPRARNLVAHYQRVKRRLAACRASPGYRSQRPLERPELSFLYQNGFGRGALRRRGTPPTLPGDTQAGEP
jgi:hypothetical protein